MRISDWSSDVCSSDLFLDSAAAVRTCPPHLTQSEVPMRICPIGGGLGFLCYHDAALCERRIDRCEALARVQRGEALTAEELAAAPPLDLGCVLGNTDTSTINVPSHPNYHQGAHVRQYKPHAV